MGIISDANKQELGKEINSAYKSAVDSVTRVKQSLLFFKSKINEMKDSSEKYSEEDWKEVESLLAVLKEKIGEIDLEA